MARTMKGDRKQTKSEFFISCQCPLSENKFETFSPMNSLMLKFTIC